MYLSENAYYVYNLLVEELTIEEAIGGLNRIFDELDADSASLEDHPSPQLIERGAEISLQIAQFQAFIDEYMEAIATFGIVEEFSSTAIDNARKYLDNSKKASMGLSNLTIGVNPNIHLLLTAISLQQKNGEPELEDRIKYENTRSLRHSALYTLGNMPDSLAELKDNAVARAVIGTCVKQGLVNLDDLIGLYGETCQEIADFMPNFDSADENLRLGMWKFTADTIMLKAAISQLDDQQREQARDKIKRATRPLLLASKQKRDSAVQSFMRREIRGFLKSLTLSSEVAKSNAGMLMEHFEANLARRTHRFQLSEKANTVVLALGLGSAATSTSPSVRLVSTIAVFGVFAEGIVSKRQLAMEDIRCNLIPGYRNATDHLNLAVESIDDDHHVSQVEISGSTREYLDNCAKRSKHVGSNVPEMISMKRVNERAIPTPDAWLDKPLGR